MPDPADHDSADRAVTATDEPALADRDERAEPTDRASDPGRSRWFVIGLVAIVAVGWALRLIYVWHWRQHTVFGGDPLYYHLGADLLADGKGFINPYAFKLGMNVQAADHPPLYMIYLAIFSKLGLGTITWHLLASTLLGAASIAVAGLAGREIVGPRAGLEPASERGRADWGRRLRLLAFGAIAYSAVVGPWVVFNLVRFDHTVILSENLGGTLATSNCDAVYYGDQIGYWNYFCGTEILAEHGIGPYEFKGVSERILRQEALSYIGNHKSRVPVVVAARIGRITGLYEPRQEAQLDVYIENTEQWVSDLGFVSYFVVAALAVTGAVVLRRRREAVFPLLAPIATVIATVALFYAATRFRATAEGVLCVMAAVAVDAVVGALVRRRSAAGASEPRVDDPVGALA